MIASVMSLPGLEPVELSTSVHKWKNLPPAQAISLLDSHLPESLSPLRLRQMSWSDPEHLNVNEVGSVAEALVKAMS
jgi:hypothetical protein